MPEKPDPVFSTHDLLHSIAEEVIRLRTKGNAAGGITPGAEVAASGSVSQQAATAEAVAEESIRLLHDAANPFHQVGRMPPVPPTPRGRTGAVLVGVIRRMVLWQSQQINEFHLKLTQFLRRQADAVAQMSRALEEVESRRSEGDRSLLHSLEQAQRAITESVGERADAKLKVARLAERLQEAESRLQKTRERAEAIESELEALRKAQSRLGPDQARAMASMQALLLGETRKLIDQALAGQGERSRAETALAIDNALSSLVEKIRGDLFASREAGREEARQMQETARAQLAQQLDSLVRRLEQREDTTLEALRQEFAAKLEQSLAAQREEMQQALSQAIDAAAQRDRDASVKNLEQTLETDRARAAAASESVLHQIADISESHKQVDRFARQTRAALSQLDSRVSILLHELRRSQKAPGFVPLNNAADQPAQITSEELDSLYVEFENAYRGSRAAIRDRMREYLPRLHARNLGHAGMPVLDLGCGRGEWLEVLGEAGLTAVGVDSNAECIRECRSRGLQVQHSDLLDLLRQRPEASEGVVSAFHVVEHLSFRALLELLDQSLRVLKPGGLIILETPNPANLLVGANTFYLDPTHLRPIPSELLRFTLEARGFVHVEAVPLHPFEDCYLLDEKGNNAAALLNQLIYGARDYVAIGERP